MIIDLRGQWRFELDPEDIGIQHNWESKILPNLIQLPGSVTENGFGDEVTTETEWTGVTVDRSWFTDAKYEKYRLPGNVKLPFWLTPMKHYKGAAWYQKEIHIPDYWQGKQIILFLERCHWETRVWVDTKSVGLQNSLSTPHEYELTEFLTPGKHVITIRVINNVIINIGPNSHSISDHTQTNWNGIIGKIELRAKSFVSIEDIQIYPDIHNCSVIIQLVLGNKTGCKVQGELNLEISGKSKLKGIGFEIINMEKFLEVEYPIEGKLELWDEFKPNLYKLYVSLDASYNGFNYHSSKTIEFGMRVFETERTHFTVNGRKTFLRGTSECAIFPLTGYPPTDVDSWIRIFKIVKAHGLNHIRFHSWCPPKAAFIAADRVGIYFQIECASWANAGPSLGADQPVDQFIYDESDRILKEYGNHPSFCLLAYGNEPAGRKKMKNYLGNLIKYWKTKDNRRVYTGGAGWPVIPENEYHLIPKPRSHQWGDGLRSRFNSIPFSTNYDYREIIKSYSVPVISHEIGQWCVYPNFKEIKKYKGILQAKNFEIFRDSLKEHQMLDQAEDFLIASGKLQAILYKEEIEAALRTPGFAGFQLLDLHDFPGQGTALVGVLDAFWEEKGYIKPEEYHQFCSETVPLVRMEKIIWTNEEIFKAEAEIAHYGPKTIKQTSPEWIIESSSGHPIATGTFEQINISIGNNIKLGSIELELNQVKVPVQLKLIIFLRGTNFRNHWNIWVFPSKSKVSIPKSILVIDSLNPDNLSTLKSGKQVLFLPPPGMIDNEIPAGFTSIFWNTQWTNRQPPHTLGILCDPNHPCLELFPTEFHSNWQWWDLITKSKFLQLDSFGSDLRPIVQVIDDWNTNRKLGLVFEASVGKGKILVCAIDLKTDIDQRPVAQQFLRSIIHYMESDNFQPKTKTDINLILDMLKKDFINL